MLSVMIEQTEIPNNVITLLFNDSLLNFFFFFFLFVADWFPLLSICGIFIEEFIYLLNTVFYSGGC